jgi:photosystem II stability/assembly factor-like uncharacterized protein
MNGLPENGAFYSVSVVDSHTVWLVANGGRVWKSFDAGKSWIAASSLPQGAGDAGTVVAMSPLDVVLASTTGKIFKTTDGGVAWIKVFDDTTVTDFFNDLEMFDDFTGYAIGDPPHPSSSRPPAFVRTTDGGQTWAVVNTNLPLGDVQYHGRTDFVSPQVGWTYVLNDGVYKTTDGGKEWKRIYIPVNGFGGLFFLNDSVGFYTWSGYPSDGGVSKTTDGGLTWRKTLSGSQIVFVRWATGGNHFWAGGDSLYLSTDVGETWQKILSAKSMGACGLLWEASFLTDDIGMISGQCAVLGMSSDPVVSVAIQKRTPEGLELKQNYPNPFNPSTTIRYAVPSRTHVVIKIFNILGDEVATLVDGVKDPGSHEVTWNGTGISSGVYLYRLQAGHFIETKKLLLVR